MSDLTGGTNKDGIAVTKAGELVSVRHIIHIDAAGCKTNDNWKNIIKTCLRKTEELRLESLSFPAIGTGENLQPLSACPDQYFFLTFHSHIHELSFVYG